MPEKQEGLAGVVIADSSMSWIDGDEGILLYQGYNIHDLAENSTFEEVVYLLWNGRMPTQSEFDEVFQTVADNRALSDQQKEFIQRYADSEGNPMAFLRTAVSLQGYQDPLAEENAREANMTKAYRLVAQIPILIAAFHRARNGEKILDPKPEWNQGKNFLYCMHGREPDDVEARAMDVALILHADHGFNASTFASRVTSSTLSDLHSAITSAIGTLKGPLHGGANTEVMKMLKDIDAAQADAKDWVSNALSEGKRIMGFGHRVYNTMDPRATQLREFSKRLGERKGETRWYEISEKVFEVVREEIGLWPNVDFFSASTYYSLDIPLDLFTPIFASSRVVGWIGHVLEQYEDNKLIRPRANYTGPKGLDYVPIDQRT